MSYMRDEHHQIALDDVGVGLAQLTLGGDWLAANRCLSSLLGAPFVEISRDPFDTLFPVQDLQKERTLRAQLLRGEIPRYSSKRIATRGDGTVLPVRIAFSLAGPQPPHREKSILAVVEDHTLLLRAEAALKEAETARSELARRLTNAQEEERAHIARELHDDIGQSLAILRIQMLRAGQPVSGLAGKRHPTIPELCDDMKRLATKVSRLSHQLHSSELEYLGLAVAIESHCREFSEKYKIAVHCSCSGIPGDLDGLLALSLLRIVQEALHNAGKHSNAKSIQVRVRGSATELSLLIADDGVGFDLEEAKLAAGLGLISMRERVHLASGQFAIDSQPGKGTRITARVPLYKAAPERAGLAAPHAHR